MAGSASSRPRDIPNTMQLECVSCNEHFTVPLMAPEPTRRATSMAPGPALICPRCGTNNHNWFNIKYVHLLPRTEEQQNFLRSQVEQWTHWLERFPLAGLALLITILLLVWATYEAFLSQDFVQNTTNTIFLVLFTFLGGAIPIFSITSQWKQVREQLLLRTIRQTHPVSTVIPVHWRNAFIQVLAFAVFLPVLFYLIFPKIDQVVTSLENVVSPEPSLATQSQQLAENVRVLANKIPFEELSPSPQVETLRVQTQTIITATQKLQMAAAAIPELNRDTGEPPAPPASTNMPFVRIWFKVVGGSSLAAALLSILAVHMYIQRINPLLPPPIFVNVTKMTSLALHEIRNTLQIPAEELDRIEWLDTKRNDDGGILLHGIREILPDTFGRPKRVRTYLIKTDPWVRIQDIQTKNGH